MVSGKLVVISSPSGGGKTTIIRKLLRKNPELQYSISATTRAPRRGETEGKDYFFINREEFRNHINSNNFLEWAEVHGEYYGTLKSQVDACLKAGKVLVLDIDIQGGLEVKKQLTDALLIFLMPPSIPVLKQRLKSRGTEDGLSIEKRIEAASLEIQAAQKYDYIIFNNHISQAANDILSVINKN